MVLGKHIAFFVPLAALSSACEPPVPFAYVSPPPARDRLFTLGQTTPGRLEYAREPDAFAAVLTHRVAYPSQDQANYAFDRENMAALYPTKGPYVIRSTDPAPFDRRAASVHLFACRPGVVNSVTGRIDAPRAHGVHCATDFLDAQGRQLARETVNFFYYARAWRMTKTNAPTSPAPWIDPENSPTDYFSWLPFGKRSTPYN